jgi:broad specificity phosphatase PhoE
MRTWLAPLRLAAALLPLVPAVPAAADGPLRQELVPRFDGPEIVEKLRAGGYVLLMRHMATERSPDQWSGVDLADCSTQRVLSEEGQRQAREFGAAVRRLGIPIGEVLVSPYCRTRETARLAFGREGTVSPLLTTWDDLSVDEKTARATELRKRLDTRPADGKNTLLVTHTGNLLWTLGLDSKPEGLAHVFEPTGLAIARPAYLGRIEPQAWRGLADLPEPDADATGNEDAGDVAAPPETPAAP